MSPQLADASLLVALTTPTAILVGGIWRLSNWLKRTEKRAREADEKADAQVGIIIAILELMRPPAPNGTPLTRAEHARDRAISELLGQARGMRQEQAEGDAGA